MPLCCTALHPCPALNFLEGPWSFTLASVKHACPLTQQLHFWADAQLSLNYATDICWVPTVSGTVLAPGVGPPGSPGDKILGNVTHSEQAIQTASERGAPGCGRIPGHWAEGSRGRPATATQKEVTPEQDQVRGQGEPAGRGRARKGQACAQTPHSTTRGAQRAWVSFFADCSSKSVEKRSGGELIRASTWGQ